MNIDEHINTNTSLDKIPLVEEYRLIERCESEVNGAWKGAHILLFFLAFVFGSFCTFCFHMLMYLFDEKCVLFPKILSMSALRHNIIYEFIPADKDITDNLPVDFLSTQWVDQSACYLPTYVPLVSGIFGLVWTTMFLMCSSGSRTHTGLQRPWRILPPVFIFSLAMTVVCMVTSIITHSGLQELCVKLGEITGSFSCTYTINVATLAYERRIRGVYQATRLTILSAWLHTACWLLSAMLTLARVLMAVDFQLVRVRVELRCNIDKMLEQNERQLHTVAPDIWINDEIDYDAPVNSPSPETTSVYYKNRIYNIETNTEEMRELKMSESDMLYFSEKPEGFSELSLVPAERCKLARLLAYQTVPKDKKFIVKLVYDLVDTIVLPEMISKNSTSHTNVSSSGTAKADSDRLDIIRQFGQEQISSTPNQPIANMPRKHIISVSKHEAKETAREIRRTLQEKLNRQIVELSTKQSSPSGGSNVNSESSLNITPDMKKALELKSKSPDKTEESLSLLKPTSTKKSNLKNMGIQTDTKNNKKEGTQKVQISESQDRHIFMSNTALHDESAQDQETQTSQKEKQD